MALIKKINYIASLILIVCWAIGYFSHEVGTSVHYLLVGALVLILINVIQDNTTNSPDKI